LNSTVPVLKPSAKPPTDSEVRRAFSEARRSALQRQGTITFERVRQNQATMKVLPSGNS